ncbi:MAG: copper amine oxidase N-terminal domain-containing protein, partial [Clostridia bacterium]|nr:copper amine oxidase N-terminal domain-containing protein [Clostridia bacterium]
MKRMKKILAVILSVCMLVSLAPVAFAEQEIIVEVDGERLLFDVPPQIINDRTMVPMRAIFEKLGATITWDPEDRTVMALRGNEGVMVSIDSHLMVGKNVATNATFVRYLEAAPVIVDDRTLVPARAVSEALCCDVEWVASQRKVVITSGNVEQMTDDYYPYTDKMQVNLPTYTFVTGVEPMDVE